LYILIYPDKNKHPDTNKVFQIVCQVFKALSNLQKKVEYNCFGGDPVQDISKAQGLISSNKVYKVPNISDTGPDLDSSIEPGAYSGNDISTLAKGSNRANKPLQPQQQLGDRNQKLGDLDLAKEGRYSRGRNCPLYKQYEEQLRDQNQKLGSLAPAKKSRGMQYKETAALAETQIKKSFQQQSKCLMKQDYKALKGVNLTFKTRRKERDL
jgi:hypothetical protein